MSPGQGQTAPRGRSFDVNRNILSLHLLVAIRKQISLKSDFIKFFHDLIHRYSPGSGTDSPLGDTILMSTEWPYHFTHSLQISKKSL